MIIGIDWNNTLQDQLAEIIRQTYLLYGAALNRNDFSTWDAMLGDRIGVDNDTFTAWAWKSDKIQQQARPFPWAKEVVRLLYQQYTIKIITSSCHPQVAEGWLYRHGIPYHELISTSDKGSIEWDVLIDDNPITLETLCVERHVLRYELPWNAHLHHIPAVTGWNLALIHRLEDIAQIIALNSSKITVSGAANVPVLLNKGGVK